MERVRRALAGAAVGEKRGEPLRTRTVEAVSLRGAVGHATSISWIRQLSMKARLARRTLGERRTRFAKPAWGDAGASAIDSAVTRRDGWQVLRFGGLEQPSIVDAEGGEAVPVGVRGCQVYRI